MDDDSYQRIAPRAREIAATLEPDEDDIGTSYLNPLRKLSSKTEKRLEQEDFKEERKGVSVTDPRTWKNRLDEVRDQHLYLYLLRDSIETYLVFYQRYHGVGVGDMDALAEYVEDANGLSGSEKNLLETWEWLQDVDVPTELKHRQETLDTVIAKGDN